MKALSVRQLTFQVATLSTKKYFIPSFYTKTLTQVESHRPKTEDENNRKKTKTPSSLPLKNSHRTPLYALQPSTQSART